MTNIDAVGAPAPPPPPPCQNPTVELEVEHPIRTLKHAHANLLRIVVSPPACRASAYKIEIQRASGGAWFPLATVRTFRWLARVAGTFKLRGTATIDGADVQSGTKDVEVKFPTYAQIVGDGHTRRSTARVWAETRRDCTQNPNRRRELGYWIRLDTRPRVNRYILTDRTEGNWRAPGQGASVSIPPRPADDPANPDPNARGAKYAVASFHTHTPTVYRVGFAHFPRPIGPSGGPGNPPGDAEADTADQVPGVVYDYMEDPPGSGSIPIGHPLDSPAQLYLSLGIDPRPTP